MVSATIQLDNGTLAMLQSIITAMLQFNEPTAGQITITIIDENT